jgi:14-3-3 protein epsilon
LLRKGDYYRYLAEFSLKENREHFGSLSLEAYKVAYKHAVATLHPVHPTRLGLALNFSVFYHGQRGSYFSSAVESKEIVRRQKKS